MSDFASPLTPENVTPLPMSSVAALLFALRAPQHPDYILIDQLDCCRVGGISVATWYRLVRQGLMPKPIKVGRASRWELSAVLSAYKQLHNAQ